MNTLAPPDPEQWPPHFAWSFGANRYDVQPQQYHGDLRAFAAFAVHHRVVTKERAGYICGPLAGDGRRCRANALPRNWLALDVDRIAPDVHVDWRLHLTRWCTFGWPTASSTPEAPRERAIVVLDKPVDYEDGVRLGALLSADAAVNFGTDVLIDASTYRAAQPCFLPPPRVRPFYTLGAPLDVLLWLAQAPPVPPPPPPLDEAGAEIADVRMRHLVGRLHDLGLLIAPLNNGQGFAMHCPWAATHSSDSGASATAVMLPAEANGWRGGFSCLHSHCRGRRLHDLFRLVIRVDAMEPERSHA